MLTNYTTGPWVVAGSGASDRALRMIIGRAASVKLDLERGSRLPPDAKGDREAEPFGGSGESGYRNRFLPDGRILYMGEGKRGDQEPVGGTCAFSSPTGRVRP